MCCVEAGMQVFLLDKDDAALEKGLATIRKNYQRSVDRRSKTQEAVDGFLSLIKPVTNYSELATCDIVIEAVFENLKIKQDIFKLFDEHCKQGCVLATNTSYIDIDVIASAVSRPQDVIGCHFFSPANVMKLLENVKGAKTSDKTIATAMTFGKKIKKFTCLVATCPGFCANRMNKKSGAGALLHSGVSQINIDKACEDFGIKMGPFRVADLVGIDLFGRERERNGTANPDEVIPDAMFSNGRFGQKNMMGYYKYNEKREHSECETAQAIIQNVWKNLGVLPREISNDEIIQEIYFPVINEGFDIIEEGIVSRASDIDVCLVYGSTWPKHRGGPMYFASQVGFEEVRRKLLNNGIKPANLLTMCAMHGWKLDSIEVMDYIKNKKTSNL